MLKMLKYLKPFWVGVLLTTAFIAAQCMLDLWLPDILANVTDQMQIATAYEQNGVLSLYSDEIIRTMLKYGGYSLAIALSIMALAIGVSYFSSRVAMAFGRDLRKRLFERIESFSLAEFDKISTASLITRTTNDITQVTNAVMTMMRLMVRAPFMMVGGIIMSLRQNISLSMVIIGVLPLMLILIVITMLIGLPLFVSMQKKIDNLTQVAREGLTGVRVVRAFNADDKEKRRFAVANADITQTAIKVNKIMSVMMPIMTVLFSLAGIVVFWVGGNNINTVSFASVMAVSQYAMRIMFSFMMFAMLFIILPRAGASAKRINEILATEPSITDLVEASPQNSDGGRVEFRNVSYTYGGEGDNTIDGVSFVAEAGKTTAIIGGTGSGKTTLINLLLRFYDVTGGEVLVAGNNVKDYLLHDLRAKIGYVPQVSTLFYGTIRDNIAYGKEDATEEEILQAVRIAQADFIFDKPDGLDEQVSQGGLNFSGGQKQRLSIARALVRKPEIYVFDDSFSALDFKTDSMLRAQLAKSTGDASVIIVAQRIATIMNADKILVLKDGKIIGQGTHSELMKDCDEYRSIAQTQISEAAQ